jgi:hypothetical protein
MQLSTGKWDGERFGMDEEGRRVGEVVEKEMGGIGHTR